MQLQSTTGKCSTERQKVKREKERRLVCGCGREALDLMELLHTRS